MSLKIKKSEIICITIILLQFIYAQIAKYCPSVNGAIYKLIFYMKYFGAFALMLYTLSRKCPKDLKKKSRAYVKMFSLLFLLYIPIEAVALFSSPVALSYGLRYWTRFAAYLLDKICILIEVVCLFRIFGDDLIRILSISIIADEVISVIVSVAQTGIIATLKVIPAVFGLAESAEAMSILEIHEVTYCAAICVIYYCFFCPHKKRSEKVILALLIMTVIMGGKRIVFGGILVSGLFAWIVRRKGLSKKFVVTIGLTGITICVLLVCFIYNGWLIGFFKTYGINPMGRELLWGYFTRRTEFSPAHLGWGLAATTKAMENMAQDEILYMGVIRGLHNDIFKMYIECGFMGFLGWLIFDLIHLPLRIYKKFGRNDATIYISIVIFTFICYITSNIENSFIYQVVFLSIPLCVSQTRANRLENK